MAVRILTARPHRLFPAIVEEMGACLRQGLSAVLLVPEQFTLSAESELMERLHLTGMFALEVLSPSRLYEHILSDAGRDGREPLSDAGRRMALSQALERLEDKLPYYGIIVTRRGFVEKLSALITDFKRGGMTAESLEAYASSLEDGLQKSKLSDLAVIYRQYDQVLKGRFSDSEDQLAYVASKLADSRYLKGKCLYVYGFDTLPQQMMQLLCDAAPLCSRLVIGLVCDGQSATDGDLYLPIRQGTGRFAALLREKQGMDCTVVPLPAQPLEHAPEITHLDQMLFALSPATYPQQPKNLLVSSALTPFEEASLMSRQVMKLLEDGMPPERIAILYPESGGYDFAVAAALNDSGLPFYTDTQLPALSHGLVSFLLCSLRAMADGWRNRDMLGLLKSGYAPLSFEETCELENYARVCGIDRKRWAAPFTRGEKKLCERAEALRIRLMSPLLSARQALIDARDSTASLTAVFQLLMDVNAYERLQQEEERLLHSGFSARANQNSQIWQAVLTLLDQALRLSGQSRIPLRHMAARLECGFSAMSLASLPPAGGMLHAGVLGHLLAEEADVVFLLGMNDGLLSRTTDSLLSPDERARTEQDIGCFMGLTDENRALLAKLDLKRAMTLPRKQLYLSFARTAADGTALRPLSLLSVLGKRLFAPDSLPHLEADPLPLSATQALSQLGLRLRAHEDGLQDLPQRWKERLDKLLRSPATAADAMRLLRSVHHNPQAQPLQKEQARLLYGDRVLSVSRLEQFAGCPFRHFVTYGLRPHLLKEWKIDPIETGTFYHAGLNNFARLAKREAAYPHISEERVQAMADAAIEPLIDELMQGPMGDGDRSLARFEQARSAIRRAAGTLTQHLAAGRFTLWRTEANFGYEGGLPPIVLLLADGREIALRGRIDRIDRYDAPDSVYLRVIDYKSACQSLDAAKTWWGLQLQLLLYLDVCVSALPNAQPAGAFYFYVADPLVDSETDVRETVEGKLREVFQLRGIALSDVEILHAMDENEVPFVLPSMHLKSGELKKTAAALDMPQMQALLRHARDVAADLAGRMLDGDTSVSPTRDGSRTNCDLCDYRAICRFECESPEAPFRSLASMSMEDLREALFQSQQKKQ